MLQMQPHQRHFLELSISGTGKALYLPADAVLTYEHVPEGKNEHFPQGGTFLRYDYGEGLLFSIVEQPIDQLKNEIGPEGFLALHLPDDSELFVKDNLIQAIQEIDDEGKDATRLSVNLGGQIGSLYVNDSYTAIKEQRGQ